MQVSKVTRHSFGIAPETQIRINACYCGYIEMKFKLDEQARRQGKSEAGMMLIGFCIAQNKPITIGTVNPDTLYDKIIAKYPEAKLTKGDCFVIIEKSK